MTDDDASTKAASVALLRRFEFERVLSQDQSGRRIHLLGSISGAPALLSIERAAFPSSPAAAALLPSLLDNVQNLGANDVYSWYLASLRSAGSVDVDVAQDGTRADTDDDDAGGASAAEQEQDTIKEGDVGADLKLNLIHPCAAKHVAKYSPQTIRSVFETPSIYATHIAPFIARQVASGRMDWVYNILSGAAEQEDVILRQSRSLGKDEEGFLLLPDMNWDRVTMGSLRVLGLVERRDLRSLRDLRKRDVPWLRGMVGRMLEAVERVYGDNGVERDLLKVYVHYQPTYYHFHVHIVSTQSEPNATQAVGKAFSLPNLIGQLESMAGGPDAGLADVELSYTVGEASDIWKEVWGPLKRGDLKAEGETAA